MLAFIMIFPSVAVILTFELAVQALINGDTEANEIVIARIASKGGTNSKSVFKELLLREELNLTRQHSTTELPPNQHERPLEVNLVSAVFRAFFVLLMISIVVFIYVSASKYWRKTHARVAVNQSQASLPQTLEVNPRESSQLQTSVEIFPVSDRLKVFVGNLLRRPHDMPPSYDVACCNSEATPPTFAEAVKLQK